MRRAIRVAMRLYPAAWRERYGREFEALLEDVGPGWREFWDVVTGALKMQMMTWTWTKTAAAFGVAGALAAAVIALHTPNTYVSTAVVRVASGPSAWRGLLPAQQEVLSRTSLAAIIQRYGLYPEERKRLPLEDVVMSMRNRYIHISPITGLVGETTFAISFQYPDRGTAQQVTKDLTSRFLESSVTSTTPMTLQVLDAASLPQAPSSPNRLAIIGSGLAAGLMLGLLFVGVRRWPMVAACGAGASVLALGLAFCIPDRYKSTAVLQLDAGADAAQLIRDTLTDKTLGELIQRPDLRLYENEGGGRPLDELIRRMRDRDLHVRVVQGKTRPGVTPFVVSFQYSDRYKAQAVVRVLVTRMTEQHVAEMRERSNKPVAGLPNLQVLDPASLPEEPSTPNRVAILLFGLGLGLAGGVVILRRRRPKALVASAV